MMDLAMASADNNLQHTDVSFILKKLKVFREEGRFCDACVYVSGARFSAHRAILAAWSPRLSLEISGVREDKEHITIQNCDQCVFETLLDFMYSGSITVTDQNVLQLLKLAQALLIETVTQKCEDFLMLSVDSNNFVDCYFTALKLGLLKLQEKVFDFVQVNISTIVERNEIPSLEPQDLKHFLTEGKMTSLNQEVKFSLITCWVSAKLPERSKFLLHLFNQVSWDTSVKDLLDKLNYTENVFIRDDFCLFQFLHSLNKPSTAVNLGSFTDTYSSLYSLFSNKLEDLANPEEFNSTSQYLAEHDLVTYSIKRASEHVSHCLNDIEVNPVENVKHFEDEDFNEIKVPVIEMDIDDSVENYVVPKNEETLSDIHSNSSKKCRRKSVPRKRSKHVEPAEKSHSQIRKRVQNRRTKSNSKKKERLTEQQTSEVISYSNDNEKSDIPVLVLECLKVEKEERMSSIIKDSDGGVTDINTAFPNSVEEAFRDVKSETISQPDAENEPRVKNENKEVDDNNWKLKVKLNSKPRPRGRPPKSKNKEENKKDKSAKIKTKIPTPRPPKIPCTYKNCRFLSISEKVLNDHIERVHVTDVELKCHKCEYATKELGALCLHMKTHFSTAPYKCDREGCSRKFTMMNKFINHQMTHRQLRPFKCDLCEKQFVSYNQLSTHKRRHSGYQFQCDVCLKRFPFKGSMLRHQATHFNVKPYLCDICGFCTKDPSHLNAHRKIHTGNVLHCTYPNCNYTSPQTSHMNQHIKGHLNCRDHICQVCGKGFSRRSRLYRHEKIHLKEKLFKCKQCDYRTSRTDRMKLHIESHGIKFPRRKYNEPNFDENKYEKPIDYHHFYEKVDDSKGSNSSQYDETLTPSP